MRLAIVGTVLALAVTAAAAQSPAQITGNKAFCLKGDKIDCSFDTMASCEKMAKERAPAGSQGPTCVSRNEAR